MTTSSQNSTFSPVKIGLDMLWLSAGLMLGGIIALGGLGLWLDYHSQPGQSYLAWLSAQLAGFVPGVWRNFLEEQARLMGLPLSAQTSAYWYMARAGGIVAYGLLWLATVWGLILSTKVVYDRIPASLAYGLHEFLSWVALSFVLLHTFILLGDSYIKFNLLHLLIPFTAPYKPFWTGLGVLAFYLGLVVTASFYVRKQISQKLWRSLHYLTFGAYGLALAHGLMAGSDSSLSGIKLMYLSTGLMVLFLIFYRLLALNPPSSRRSH